MFINKLKLQNFRCFSSKTFSFESNVVLIEGDNGSGKTTLLEALHYACYFKSFRTGLVRDLINLDKNHFFFSVNFDESAGEENQIQIGLSTEESPMKRVVQFNGKKIRSYKDLISHYRVISLAEDDLLLVQGGPEHRRLFLNQLVLLFNPEFLTNLKRYEQIKEHRNSLLRQGKGLEKGVTSELTSWSKQLWEASIILQQERIARLKELEKVVNELLVEYFSQNSLSVTFTYNVKKDIMSAGSFEGFWKTYSERNVGLEWKLGRGLFGAHLDDFLVIFQKKGARAFASRGQQKLVVFLLKIAELKLLEQIEIKSVLLLDDFLTDFDQNRISQCLDVLSKLDCQAFVSCPIKSFLAMHYKSQKNDVQVISL